MKLLILAVSLFVVTYNNGIEGKENLFYLDLIYRYNAYCFDFGMDYFGNDIRNFYNCLTAWHCQWACQAEEKCQAWTFSKRMSRCWLKTKAANFKQNYDLISGPKECAVEEGTSYEGNDLTSTVTSNALDCMKECSQYYEVEMIKGPGCKNSKIASQAGLLSRV